MDRTYFLYWLESKRYSSFLTILSSVMIFIFSIFSDFFSLIIFVQLMSLVEDLMLELQTMKQTNSDLKTEMERSKQTVSTSIMITWRAEDLICLFYNLLCHPLIISMLFIETSMPGVQQNFLFIVLLHLKAREFTM